MMPRLTRLVSKRVRSGVWGGGWGFEGFELVTRLVRGADTADKVGRKV